MTALLQRSRDFVSMDRLFFSGRVLPGREIMLNAGGGSRSFRAPLPSDDDCSPIVVKVRRERKVTIFPGGFTHSHTHSGVCTLFKAPPSHRSGLWTSDGHMVLIF